MSLFVRNYFLDNLEDSGNESITGNTKTANNEPVAPRRVVLLKRNNCKIIKSTWSDADTGLYSFDRLKNQNYIAIAIDHTNYWNAAVADRPPFDV